MTYSTSSDAFKTWFAFKQVKRLILPSSVVAGVVCFGTIVHANDWDFSPYVGLSNQFTDNARSSGTNKESDFITSIDLGFTLSGETRRSQLKTSYNVSQDYYAHNHDLDGYRQNFLGQGSFEVIEDSFFVDARATFTEETLESGGSSSATDRTQADGRTQVFNGRISPYYQHNFGGWATGIARYSYSETRFSEPNVGGTSTAQADRKANEVRLSLNSGRRFAQTSWKLDGGLISSESDDGDSFEHFSFTASGQVPVSRYFSLIGTVGYDEFDVDNVDNSDIGGLFGGAGIRFHPNSRTDASIQIGHRFGDPVLDVDVSYSPTSVDRITGTYRVSIGTADQSLADVQLLDIEGRLVRPNFSVTDYINEVTKSERLSIGWTRQRGRNTYGLSGSFVEREILSDNSKDQSIDVQASFSRRLTKRATLSANSGYSEVIEGRLASSEDTTYRLGANYRYDFGNGLSGTLSYNFLNKDEAAGPNVRENSLSISVRKSF